MKPILDRFAYLLEIIPPKLEILSAEEYSLKPNPDKWSKKEILGHLIDSAAANHHRFIRGQFEKLPEISYDQNRWNKFGYYQDIDAKQLVSFWTFYNKQILEIVSRIPINLLSNEVNTGSYIHNLAFLIEDYVAHIEHHMKQIVEY